MQDSIGIYYFSGTGNTAFVVRELKNQFEAIGRSVTLITMESILKLTTPLSTVGYSMIGLAFPIHNWGPALTAFRFVKLLPKTFGLPCFIIETGAGPQGVVVNEASTLPIVRRLSAKGYRIVHEYQFTMASNWLVGNPPSLQKQFCEIVPQKAAMVCHEISRSVKRRMTPGLFPRLLLLLGWYNLPLMGTIYGRGLSTNERCTRCGKCVTGCPAGNIRFHRENIRFGWHCTSCMRCAYGCPVRAIVPRIGKCFIVPNWYGTEALMADTELRGNCVTTTSKGPDNRYRKYLLEKE